MKYHKEFNQTKISSNQTNYDKTSFPGAIEQNIINIVHKKWSAQINLVPYIIFYFTVGKKLKQKESKKP